MTPEGHSMKRIISLSILSFACLALACADENATTDTNTLALTDSEAEALETCIAELEACRQSVDSAEEFREVCGELHACLPERETEGAREADWRQFCADVAQRCANAEASDEDCAALQDRCDRSFAGGEEASMSEKVQNRLWHKRFPKNSSEIV